MAAWQRRRIRPLVLSDSGATIAKASAVGNGPSRKEICSTPRMLHLLFPPGIYTLDGPQLRASGPWEKALLQKCYCNRCLPVIYPCRSLGYLSQATDPASCILLIMPLSLGSCNE